LRPRKTRRSRFSDEAFIAQLAIATTSGGGGGGTAWVQGGNSFGAPGVFGTNDANVINIRTNSITRGVWDLAGNLVPPADNTGQIGTAALRWALVRATTVTSGDLVLLDDDGTAHLTFKEHAEGCYMFNDKTGELHKLLTEKVKNPPPELIDSFAKQSHGARARAEAEAAAAEEAAHKAEEEAAQLIVQAQAQAQVDEAPAAQTNGAVSEYQPTIIAQPEWPPGPAEEGLDPLHPDDLKDDEDEVTA
jgi:hypothetical protein